MSELYVCVREPEPFEAGRATPTDAEALRDRFSRELGAALEGAGMGRSVGTAKATVGFGAENGRAGAFTIVSDDPMAEEMVRRALSMNGGELGSYAVAAVFETSEPMVAESLAWDIAWKLGAQERIALHFLDDAGEAAVEGASKSIEVYYDIAEIPAAYSHPLDFRNEAMALVERALEDAGAGEWAGAEIGMGEVNFGFEVEDFERAEKIVRAAVKGTPFEGIREITRFSHPEDVHAAR